MICGYLLARVGIDVIVLEKHADFFRDFRGDTVHPSTLQAIYELGLLDDFLALAHQEVRDVLQQFAHAASLVFADERSVSEAGGHAPNYTTGPRRERACADPTPTIETCSMTAPRRC